METFEEKEGQVMIPDKVKEAARNIGAFYLQKNHGDFKAAELEILKLQISSISVDDKLPNSVSIAITTGRPGLLIGKRGENIDALTKFLGTQVKVIEDRDPLSSYLIPDNGWMRP